MKLNLNVTIEQNPIHEKITIDGIDESCDVQTLTGLAMKQLCEMDESFCLMCTNDNPPLVILQKNGTVLNPLGRQLMDYYIEDEDEIDVSIKLAADQK